MSDLPSSLENFDLMINIALIYDNDSSRIADVSNSSLYVFTRLAFVDAWELLLNSNYYFFIYF